MQLTLDGVDYVFIPIKDFRTAYNLPSYFGVALFEPKDYSGLGRIDSAGSALNSVRAAVLAALPRESNPTQWLNFLPELTRLFETQLQAINTLVGLKQVEIEYAVSGFGDALQAFIYALLKSSNIGDTFPSFHRVYHDWLNSTVRLYAQQYPCSLNGEAVRVQIVAHAYGRIGLLIHTAKVTYAVYEPSLACPAEGFMMALLAEVAECMVRR